jgi:hypothetical protein
LQLRARLEALQLMVAREVQTREVLEVRRRRRRQGLL